MNNALLPLFDKLRVNPFNVFLQIIIFSLKLLDPLFKRVHEFQCAGSVARKARFK